MSPTPPSKRRGVTSTSLRPIGMPRALLVRPDDEGRPVAVARVPQGAGARSKPGVEARVEHIEEIWRVAEAWWRESSQARTYYQVILDGGRPLTLFRDDVSGEWFEQAYSAATTGGPR